MKRWLQWFRRSPARSLTASMAARLAQLPAPLDSTAALTERFVVLDVEATGLNTRKDLILAIGAVALQDGGIVLGDRFHCVLKREHEVTDSVVIDGLGPDAVAQGVSVEEGLLSFLEFIQDSPLLAFHAPYDEQLLTRELRNAFDYRWQHRCIDVAELAPLLTGAPLKESTFDDWLTYFNIPLLERHHAWGDAYATATMVLQLFRLAQQQGIHTSADLYQKLAQFKQQTSPSFSF